MVHRAILYPNRIRLYVLPILQTHTTVMYQKTILSTSAISAQTKDNNNCQTHQIKKTPDQKTPDQTHHPPTQH